MHLTPPRSGRRNSPALAAVLLASTLIPEIAMPQDDSMLLDDFSGPEGRSAYGTSWRAFTDRVMGGVSDMQASVVDTDRGPALRVAGEVRLDNNGGFIQARLPLERNGQPLDATAFGAVRVVARAAPGPYYVHVRTRDTRRPWQYYRAPLEVGEAWTERTIPFAAFRGKSIAGDPDFSRLTSIAVVAYGEAFDARIDIARIEFVAAP